MVIRSQGDPSLLTKPAEAEVRALDPDLPVYGVQTMTDRLSQSVGRPRLYTVLLAIFAGVALSLAAVGIYGVMSYAVSQRAHELGIRIALGAARRDVWQLVVGQGMLLTCVGLGIGVLLAALATRVVRSLLFGVGPTDAVTYGLVAGVLACVALVACYVPARRAARVDPMDALRPGEPARAERQQAPLAPSLQVLTMHRPCPPTHQVTHRPNASLSGFSSDPPLEECPATSVDRSFRLRQCAG